MNKKKRMGRLAAALCLCLIFGLSACGGGSGSGASTKLLESEFSDAGNWTVYQTYDQLEDTAVVSATSAGQPARVLNQENIVTYTANGLVAEVFNYLAVTGNSIAVGSLEYGVSMLRFEDLDVPKGNVYNCRQSGLEGLAAYQGRFYAWFGDGRLVDVATCEAIYSDAPKGTSTTYTGTLKNRLVIEEGNYYIGTSNLDADDLPIPGMDNGLWKIDAALSGKTKLFDHPVWSLYRDIAGTVWAGTLDGIYRQNNDVFEKIHDGYAEQIFEFDGQTYALIKDFFHIPVDETDFDLYEWDDNQNTFIKKCETSAIFGYPAIMDMYAFAWNDTLYVTSHGDQTNLLVFDGSAFSLQDTPIYDGKIGQHCALADNGKLFTVGNLTGLNIWDGVDYTQLNTVNTAEGLLSNDIQVLHVHSEGSLWIGSPTSGFNTLDEAGNFTSHEIAEEYRIGGIFEHGGSAYVQGAVTVYEADPADVQPYVNFASNGERVYYDISQGRLWAFPNFGSGNGALGMLDMDTMEIWGTTGHDGKVDYWQRDYDWDKPPFHFNDVVAIPGESGVFIALENGDHKVLKYDYLTDTFTGVDIPIASIRYFDRTTKAVFGVGQGSIVKYEKGSWTVVNAELASDSPVDLLVKHQYAFVPTAYNLEVVHLESGKTSVWNFDELPIKGQIQTIAMRTNQSPGVTEKAYAISFGTDRGLVICNLNLQ